MKKTKITKRLSLRAKFKDSTTVEVVIMDEFNNVQIEVIPVCFNYEANTKSDAEMSEEVKPNGD